MRKFNIEKPCTRAHSIFHLCIPPIVATVFHSTQAVTSQELYTFCDGPDFNSLRWIKSSFDMNQMVVQPSKAASVMCSSTACPATPQIPVTMKVPAKSAKVDPAKKASHSQPVIMKTNCQLHWCACCRFL
jgi:hypothetical protein